MWITYANSHRTDQSTRMYLDNVTVADGSVSYEDDIWGGKLQTKSCVGMNLAVCTCIGIFASGTLLSFV